MRIFSASHTRRRVLCSAGRLGLTLALLLVLGLTVVSSGTAEQPSKGGTILWAVHEGMPDFDIHSQGTYIAAQPIGPLYNGLLTFDVYDNEKIVGDLAERWEISEDGKRITFALRKGVKFSRRRQVLLPVPMPNIVSRSSPIRSAPPSLFVYHHGKCLRWRHLSRRFYPGAVPQGAVGGSAESPGGGACRDDESRYRRAGRP